MRFSLQQLSKTLNAVPRIASTSEVATVSFAGAEPSPVPQVAGTIDDYVRQMFDGVQALSIFSKNSRPELPSAISTPPSATPKDLAGILEELNKPRTEFSPLAIAAEDDVPSALRPYRR